MPVVKKGGSINSDLLCNLSTFDNMQQTNLFGGRKPTLRSAKGKTNRLKGGAACIEATSTPLSGNDFMPPLGLPASTSGQLSQFSDVPTMITPAMQPNFVYPFYYDNFTPQLLYGGKKTVSNKTKHVVKLSNIPRTPSIPSPRLQHTDASFAKQMAKKQPNKK